MIPLFEKLYLFFFFFLYGGAEASWFVNSTPDKALWVPSLAWDIGLVFLGTQVAKWVPATLIMGVTLRWTSIPAKGK